MSINWNIAAFNASFGTVSQLPAIKEGIFEVAFIGRSNVGKSSLINKLLNRKDIARTSASPGKTATINFYKTGNPKSKYIYLADLPGYGYAKVNKSEKLRFSKLIDGYFKQKRNIALVVLLIDFRHPPTNDDIDVINFLKSKEILSIIVLTKADKLNKTEKEAARATLSLPFESIEFSKVTGEGTEDIRKKIEKAIFINEENE